MRLTFLTAAVLAAFAFPAHADTIIDRANGYTLDAASQLQRFTSLAFDDLGRIVAVGSEQQTAAALPRAEHIDVQGKTLLPGLIDAHGHVFELGEISSGVELYSPSSLNGAVKAVADFARSHPKNAWIIGFGWNQEIWKLGRFPTAAELDAVVKDRPVLLHRVDGHAIRPAARSSATPAASLPACWSTRPWNWSTRWCRCQRRSRRAPRWMWRWRSCPGWG
jgi:predicted amidohydrolase YtcJ